MDDIFVLEKKYALLESVDAYKYIQKIKMYSVNTFHSCDKSLQSYPPTRCLTPDEKVYNELIYTVTTNSIIVNLPEPVPKSGCKNYNLPTTLYTFNIISYYLDNKLNKFDNFTVQTMYKRCYEIQDLMPFAEYKLLLTLSNFYSDQLAMNPLFGSEVILSTKRNKLDAPKNVTVQALTPTIAVVYWMPSEKLNCVSMIYKVYWTSILNNMTQKNELLINDTEHKINGKLFTIIEPLIPAEIYNVYVRIYPANYSELHTDSLSKTLYMYSEPNNITLNETSITSMTILWIPSVNLTIHYVLEYKNVEMQKWQIAKNFKVNNGMEVMYYIKKLPPETRHEFRLRLRYPKYEKDFIYGRLKKDLFFQHCQ